jgi:hypothetical protein
VGFPCLGVALPLFEGGFLLGEFRVGAFFFKDRRQRLKLKPRAFKRAAKRSSLKSAACGWRSRTRCLISPNVSASAAAIAIALSTNAAVNFAGRPP